MYQKIFVLSLFSQLDVAILILVAHSMIFSSIFFMQEKIENLDSPVTSGNEEGE